MSELNPKDIVESLGYKLEDFKTPEEFREKVSAEWIRKANAEKDEGIQKQIVGKMATRVENAAISVAKELGISVTEDELKHLKYTDERVKHIFGKVKELHVNETTNLKKLADSKGKELATELQTKLDRMQSDFDVLKGENEKLSTGITEKEKWANEQIKLFKINDFKSKAKEKVNGVWKDSPSEFEKLGFETKMNEKYDVDIDDKEGLIVFEKASKKRIPNHAVVNSFMTYEQVMEMELKAAGLDKKNVHKDTKPVNPFPSNGQNNNTGGKDKFPVNPRFDRKG